MVEEEFPNQFQEIDSNFSLVDSLKKRRISTKIEKDYPLRFDLNVEIMKLLLPKATEEEKAINLAMWQRGEECLEEIMKAKREGRNKVLKDVTRFFDWWELELELLNKEK